MFVNQTQQRAINTYPAWKNMLVIIVLVFGVIYSLANTYPSDPAIQISPESTAEINQQTVDKISKLLVDKNIIVKSVAVEGDGNILVRLNNETDQAKAQPVLNSALGQDYIVAINQAHTVPDWLSALNAEPMKLGLDLSGGIHFLLEVDMDVAVEKSEQQYVDDLKTTLREKKLRYSRVEVRKGVGLLLKFRKEEVRDEALSLIEEQYPGLIVVGDEQSKFFNIKARISEKKLKEIRDYAVEQNTTILRTRVDELGVAEPFIQRQGANRIVVQLPGVQDSTQAKKIIGVTASVEFHLQHLTGDVQSALKGRVPSDASLYYRENGQPILLNKSIVVEGMNVSNASFGVDENGGPQVNIALDSKGASRMTAISGKNVGKPLAVLFTEYKTEYEEVDGVTKAKDKLTKIEKVISVATIRTTLGSRFVITGLDSAAEATNLVMKIRAGALIAPLKFVSESTIGPSLGQENIDKGKMAIMIGMALVLAFMLVYYKAFGMIANVALVVNMVLLIAVMSLLHATLTLPGIAGIVLTVGMAVDANVLIFERIKEELSAGSGTQKAIHNGYDSAFSTIMDANITTLIAAVILFAIGTGTIKGFAVTLAIGILTSMFTAIVASRALVNLIYGGKSGKTLSI